MVTHNLNFELYGVEFGLESGDVVVCLMEESAYVTNVANDLLEREGERERERGGKKGRERERGGGEENCEANSTITTGKYCGPG